MHNIGILDQSLQSLSSFLSYNSKSHFYCVQFAFKVVEYDEPDSKHTEANEIF